MLRSLILAVLVLAAPAVRAQEGRSTGDATDPLVTPLTTQDPIEKLKENKNPFFKVREEVSELWQDPNRREQLVLLTSDPSLPPNVLVAIGSVLADNGVRGQIPHFIKIVVEQKLEPKYDEQVKEFVLYEFHKRQSIFGDVEKNLVSLVDDEVKFARCAGMFSYLVQQLRTQRLPQEDRDRYTAMADLVRIWGARESGLSQGNASSLGAVLTQLTSGVIEHPNREAWVRWLKAHDSEKKVTIESVLKAVLAGTREELTQLRETYILEIARLVRLMARTGESPHRYLVDENVEIRRQAIQEMKVMARTVSAEQRGAIVQTLLEYLGRDDLAWDRLGGIVEVAGAFGAMSTAGEKAGLSSVLLDLSIPGSPAEVSTVLNALLDIGVVEDAARVVGFYDSALANDTEAGRSVRSLVVRIAQIAPGGAPLVMRALGDPDAGVRADAAAALKGLATNADDATAVERIRVLAESVSGEKDSVARQRMMETLYVLLNGRASRVTTEVVSSILRNGTGEDDSVRLGVVRICALGLTGDGLDAATVDRAQNLIRQAVEVRNHDDLAGKTVRFLLEHPSDRWIEILSHWLGSATGTDDPWEDVFKFLVDRYKARGEAPALWTMAASMAHRGGADWHKRASTVGQIAVDVIANDAGHPLARQLPVYRDDIVVWEIASNDEDLLKKALGHLNRRLETADNGKLLVQRSVLREKLGDRAGAVGDLNLALTTGSDSLGGLEPGPQWRRLAGLEWKLGHWSPCRDAVAKARASGEVWARGVLLSARSSLVDPQAANSDALVELEKLDQQAIKALGDAFLLTRSAAWLVAPEVGLRANAANDLKRVVVKAGLLVEAIQDLLDLQAELEKAVGQLDGDDEAAVDAAKEILRKEPASSAAWVVSGVESMIRNKEVGANVRISLLLEMFPQEEAVKAISAAAEAGEGNSGNGAMARTIENWLGSLPLPEKIVQAFLKGL